MAAAMLELRGIRCRLGGRDRLVGVDLRVERGQIVGLIGPNGAGKTTLLRTAAGLLSPDAGSVWLDGEQLAARPAAARAARRAFAPPQPPWLAGTAVLDAVLLGCSPRLGAFGLPGADDVVRARELLGSLGLDALGGRDVGTLSMGERQRALLAMVLLQQAPLLLLDEPTSAQDFEGVARIGGLLRDHARGGGAVLVALHDLNVAASLCDDVVLLREGRVVVRGAPVEVFGGEALQQVYGAHVRVGTVADGVAVLPRIVGQT